MATKQHIDFRKLFIPEIRNYKITLNKLLLEFSINVHCGEGDVAERIEKAKRILKQNHPRKLIVKFQKDKFRYDEFRKIKFEYLESKLSELDNDFETDLYWKVEDFLRLERNTNQI